MRYNDLLESNSIIDNKDGWGAVPYNQEVNYFGLKVKMTPSIFLKLAAPLYEPTSADSIANHLENGGKIGSPFLTIHIPNEWEDNNFEEPAVVKNHEGRNRMIAVRRLYGNNPIEVHLFFSGAINRSRYLNSEIIKHLNEKLISEKYDMVIQGPLFDLYT